MSRPSWALKYGEALAEVASEEEVTTRVKTELDGFAQLLKENGELLEALQSPVIPLQPKANIVKELARRLSWTSAMRNFLLVVLEKDRIDDFDELRLAYRDILDQRAGIVRAEVTSARELEESDLERVEATVQAITGKKAKLVCGVDRDLIGGLRIQIGSMVYDGTIRSRLQQIRRELTS